MKPYKLNLKRIIDTATRLEGKKVSISRAQMSEARRCIFAAIWHESEEVDSPKPGAFWIDIFRCQCAFDANALFAERMASKKGPKPARRRHK